MYDAQAPLAEHAAHQQPPVAVRGIFLAAEDRHVKLRRQGQQPLDPLAEAGRLGHSAVKHVAFVVVEAPVFDASAQPIAEEHVLNRPLLQRRSERLTVELRSIARVGTGTNVGHDVDAMLGQQCEEAFPPDDWNARWSR